MDHTWFQINKAVLFVQIAIFFLGLSGKIAFGNGLGDLVWWLFLCVLGLIHLILTITAKSKSVSFHKPMGYIFCCDCFFILFKGYFVAWVGVSVGWEFVLLTFLNYLPC